MLSDTASFPVLTECILFLISVFLLWPANCPERDDKGLEFTECLFLKSLYAFPTFFLTKKK